MSGKLAGLGLAVTLLTGCAQYQEQQAIQAAHQQFAACNLAVIHKPEYAVLLPHTYRDSAAPPASVLMDETRPSAEEARLWAMRWDDEAGCRSRFIAIWNPAITGPTTNFYARVTDIDARFGIGGMTWAERAREVQQAVLEMRAEGSALDQRMAEQRRENMIAGAAMLNAINSGHIMPFSCSGSPSFVSCH